MIGISDFMLEIGYHLCTIVQAMSLPDSDTKFHISYPPEKNLYETSLCARPARRKQENAYFHRNSESGTRQRVRSSISAEDIKVDRSSKVAS